MAKEKKVKKEKVKKEKSTKELRKQYASQSISTSGMVHYKPPTGETDDVHTGGPYCYGCCGTKCAVSCVAVIAVLLVCFAYTSDGTCCSFCYWPF